MANRTKRLIRLAVAVVLMATLWLTKPLWQVASTESVNLERKVGSLLLKPCSLSGGLETISAYCGTIDVPENHAEPSGRKIKLALAWLPATGQSEPDPLFLLAGGPGEGARQSLPLVNLGFAYARKTRDVVLLDQRGTGDSNPLKCKDEEKDSKSDDRPSETEVQDAAIACAKQLKSRASVEHYTTSDAVLDLEMVRAALHVEKINLYGISYGTRVAQQYAKAFPQRVRTITLDGVVPNDSVLGMEQAQNFEDSLNRQLARCSLDKVCAEKLGDPKAQLHTLIDSLVKSPAEIKYRDITTGEHKRSKLTKAHVAAVSRILTYVPQIATLLPLLFHEANLGFSEPIMALNDLIIRNLEGDMANGMQLSVLCSEDAPDLHVDLNDENLLLGTVIVKLLQSQCAVWPHKARPTNFHAPLKGDFPALLLSGEFDPVTPPKYGTQVATTLPNAKHIIAKGQGHGILSVACLPKLFATFIETANAKSLDISCLDTLTYAPMFTGFYGWQP